MHDLLINQTLSNGVTVDVSFFTIIRSPFIFSKQLIPPQFKISPEPEMASKATETFMLLGLAGILVGQ